MVNAMSHTHTRTRIRTRTHTPPPPPPPPPPTHTHTHTRTRTHTYTIVTVFIMIKQNWCGVTRIAKVQYVLKTWTQQPVPVMSEHSAHLTSLPFGFSTWLWHRQAIFESKGDKLSSSAECRIRTWKSQDIYSPADWMPTHKPTELSRIKLKTWTQQLYLR